MRSHPAESGAPCEPLQSVPGARVVDKTPAGGLHYRLYISEQASPKDQARLMVWLHPSGSSADQVVLGRLAPDLIKHGWALMIFPQKQYRGWSGEEFPLIEPCVEDALKLPEIDPHRPVPLTFSAGGQVALELWRQVPQFWSALVLDAAYPIDTATMQPRPLTPTQIACKTPVLAIVGSKDGGCALWEKKDSPDWNQATASPPKCCGSRAMGTSSSTTRACGRARWPGSTRAQGGPEGQAQPRHHQGRQGRPPSSPPRAAIPPLDTPTSPIVP